MKNTGKSKTTQNKETKINTKIDYSDTDQNTSSEQGIKEQQSPEITEQENFLNRLKDKTSEVAKKMLGDFFQTIIVPLIASILIFPIKFFILDYKGIIIKNASLKKKTNTGSLIDYDFYYLNDATTDNVIITFNLFNDTAFSQMYKVRMTISKFGDKFFETSANVHAFGNNDPIARSIKISQLSKGEYKLKIPIQVKPNAHNFIGQSDGTIMFETFNENTYTKTPYQNIRDFQLYDVIYFYPWLSFFIILIILVTIAFLIKNKTK
jgi:hypothetical protein